MHEILDLSAVAARRGGAQGKHTETVAKLAGMNEGQGLAIDKREFAALRAACVKANVPVSLRGLKGGGHGVFRLAAWPRAAR